MKKLTSNVARLETSCYGTCAITLPLLVENLRTGEPLQLAELLLDHYPAEKADAIEHLDFAIGEFREMKMQPSLEKALRRKEILKA